MCINHRICRARILGVGTIKSDFSECKNLPHKKFLNALWLLHLRNIVTSLPWSGRDALCFFTNPACLHPPPAAAHGLVSLYHRTPSGVKSNNYGNLYPLSRAVTGFLQTLFS